MDKILEDEKVKDVLKQNAEIVRIDVHGVKRMNRGGFTEKELAKKYRINSTPTLIFLRAESEELLRIPGVLAKEDFLSLLCLNISEKKSCMN